MQAHTDDLWNGTPTDCGTSHRKNCNMHPWPRTTMPALQGRKRVLLAPRFHGDAHAVDPTRSPGRHLPPRPLGPVIARSVGGVERPTVEVWRSISIAELPSTDVKTTATSQATQVLRSPCSAEARPISFSPCNAAQKTSCRIWPTEQGYNTRYVCNWRLCHVIERRGDTGANRARCAR